MHTLLEKFVKTQARKMHLSAFLALGGMKIVQLEWNNSPHVPIVTLNENWLEKPGPDRLQGRQMRFAF